MLGIRPYSNDKAQIRFLQGPRRSRVRCVILSILAQDTSKPVAHDSVRMPETKPTQGSLSCSRERALYNRQRRPKQVLTPERDTA